MSLNGHELYTFQDFRLDVGERLLLRKGERVQLPEKAFETLCVLVRQNGHLVGKDELLAEVWPDTIVEENNLDKSVSLLRRVLGERKRKQKFIETVRGRGYRFVGEVRKLVPDSMVPVLNGNSLPLAKPQRSASGAIRKQSVGNSGAVVAISEWRREPEPDEKMPATLPPSEIVYARAANARRNLGIVVTAVFGLIAVTLAYFIYLKPNSQPLANDAPIKTIAILPFKSLISEGRNEAIEMGMADTLISKLGGGDSLIVRPISTVRRFVSLDEDPVAVGRELGVDAVLDGTIQTEGDRIRISARLSRVSDGRQLWNGQFDEEFTNIFAIQDSISQRVATVVNAKLTKNATKRYTENTEAYQLYLLGRFHVAKLTPPDNAKAIEYFERAIELDSNYTLAYVGLTAAYRTLMLASNAPPAETMPKAKAAALKAVELDPELGEAQVALGTIIFFYDWDWKKADEYIERGYDLDPNIAETNNFRAHINSNLGRHDLAIKLGTQAKELDPPALNRSALQGQYLFYARKYDESIDSLKKTIELDPNYWLPRMFIARPYIEKGMYREAIAEATKARDLGSPSLEIIALIGYSYAKLGETQKARALRKELEQIAKQRYVPPYYSALIHNALGETSDVLSLLEESYAIRDVSMIWLKIDPKLDNLRSEPRFIELMKRMNF